MQIRSIQRLELPPTADMHVHLRQAELMDLVVPTLAQGGVDLAFVCDFQNEFLKKRNERANQKA
jgi:dihydroorotase